MEPSGESIRLDTIGQIAINVKDVERATAFYRDILGMKFLFAPPKLAFFDAGGVRLMLTTGEKEFDHPASILYYKVGDIVGVHRSLAAKGVKVEEEPHVVAPMPDHDLWISSYRDSENNYFALMSEVPREG
ncbi:MAG TPA: VOC family protein [Gemmatimonadaceae bacterium]|nr:VOC family protein [Gemmatimonadaceae bacterium]